MMPAWPGTSSAARARRECSLHPSHTHTPTHPQPPTPPQPKRPTQPNDSIKVRPETYFTPSEHAYAHAPLTGSALLRKVRTMRTVVTFTLRQYCAVHPPRHSHHPDYKYRLRLVGVRAL